MPIGKILTPEEWKKERTKEYKKKYAQSWKGRLKRKEHNKKYYEKRKAMSLEGLLVNLFGEPLGLEQQTE